MISDEHKCIFVHIPRCAGSSIEDVIWPGERSEKQLWMGFVSRFRNRYQTGGLQHLLAKQIRREVGRQRFESYFKFSVVRNPFDRLVSQFSYMRRRPDLRAFIGMDRAAPFDEYLQLIGQNRHVQWEPQTSFLYDDEGALLVDFVARFEDIEQDMARVIERLGLDCDSLPNVNPIPRGPYQSYYTERSRRQVERMYREDLTQFQYAF